ncbi:MAG TPA: inositol monophosphatase family protein [Aliicoccus persicus]|uniref:inositol-phosphate phosphatase n=1 Tax=Aliicoccus persicus TaxID=930138 RepID=A0A921B667_9STAP|nr:inositol monophosphatase family protein [Aliicoccus persicus]
MEIYSFGQTLIREAGQFIRNRMTEAYTIDKKTNPNDLVTDVDKETERFIANSIKEKYSDHQLIGEEYKEHSIENTDGVVWVIDPIDGTINFVHQRTNFTISIGVFIDGKPQIGLILDVMNDVLYHAHAGHGAFIDDNRLPQLKQTAMEESLIGLNPKWMLKSGIGEPFMDVARQCRQTRSYGSAALEFAYVAAGRLEGTIFFRLSPWDFAAGIVLIEEVGGVVTNAVGDPLSILRKDSVIAGNTNVHQTIQAAFSNNEAFVKHREGSYHI